MENKKMIEDLLDEHYSHRDDDGDRVFYAGAVKTIIKEVQSKMISKEAYEDSLNMQKASNAGYESKITELKNEIDRLKNELGY